MPGRAQPLTAALQSYADRGVFRGLSFERGPSGRLRYRFVWLTSRPVIAVFDPRRRRLMFPALFPGVEPRSPLAGELRAAVRGRTDRRLPAHKRLDGRRARIACAVRRGTLDLTMELRGDHAYAVRAALSLINDLFLLLRERYPEYLIEHFGVPAE